MGKGSGWERKMVNASREAGYPAARIGASGAGTDDDLPDLVIITDHTTYVIEHKYRSEPYVALSQQEVEALARFGTPGSATPLIAFKTDGRSYFSGWKLFTLDELNKRDKGFSVTRELWDSHERTFESVLRDGEHVESGVEDVVAFLESQK